MNRDRIVDYKWHPETDVGTPVTLTYQRPDGSRFTEEGVFQLTDAGRRALEATA